MSCFEKDKAYIYIYNNVPLMTAFGMTFPSRRTADVRVASKLVVQVVS